MDDIKTDCVLVLHMEDMLGTMKELIEFFIKRKIAVETVFIYNAPSGMARVVVHCSMERDRVKLVRGQLMRINKIINVEVLESRKRW